jgi:hypothetical protein
LLNPKLHFEIVWSFYLNIIKQFSFHFILSNLSFLFILFSIFLSNLMTIYRNYLSYKFNLYLFTTKKGLIIIMNILLLLIKSKQFLIFSQFF